MDVAAFGPGNVLTALTGTSAAAAVTAGAAALMLEWGIVRGRRLTIGTLEIKQLMIRGAGPQPVPALSQTGSGGMEFWISTLRFRRWGVFKRLSERLP